MILIALLTDLIEEYNISASAINREPNGNEPYFNVEIDGVDWVCYYQDNLSLEYKLSALDEHDLRDYIGGIGIWRLGGESDDMWQSVMMSTKNVNATIDESIDCTAEQIDDLGIGNLDNDLSLYPNPSSQKINIQYNIGESPNKLTIYSVSGELITETEKITSVIDISNYDNGIYFVKIDFDQHSTFLKFIKN